MPTTLRTARGFTIIELMITLVVAGILLAIAAPSFTNIIQNSQLTTDINQLSADLNLARSEAIKRGSPVTLCKSDDFDSSPSCVSGANWHDGWIVFDDLDADANIDAGETIIRVFNSVTAGNTLVFATGVDDILYNPSGFATNDNGTFRLCDDRGINSARGLVITPSGQIRTATVAELLAGGCS